MLCDMLLDSVFALARFFGRRKGNGEMVPTVVSMTMSEASCS